MTRHITKLKATMPERETAVAYGLMVALIAIVIVNAAVILQGNQVAAIFNGAAR